MKGLLLIPDITGFTNFVNTVDIDLGVAVTNELLNTIIDSNILDVEISEIEGDAILFYKKGLPISMKELFTGFKKMYEAFAQKFIQLKSLHNIEAELSIKFIVHYGEFNIYDIKGFKKLYGQIVIESHNLLKNGDAESDYILITDDYLNALEESVEITKSGTWEYKSTKFRNFNGARNIAYHFYTYLSNDNSATKNLKSAMSEITHCEGLAAQMIL